MHIFHDPSALPPDFATTVLSVGNFDGLHLGHRFLLGRVVERARALGARALAVTFEPHPSRLLRPDAGPLLITPTLTERLQLLATTGVDAAVVLPFTAEFSRQSAEAFAGDVLLRRLHAVEVHEGSNFRFGHRAQADCHVLSALGAQLGFGVHIYGAQQVRGMAVSSSLVRKLVAAGDMRRARWLLGRPFSMRSTPVRGRGIGTRLTVPTINLADTGGVTPAAGVYITRMLVGEQCFDAVTNVGVRPTFADASFAIETHLLDFTPLELTDATPLQLFFLARLRDEQTWPSPEALLRQIGLDVQAAQRYLRGAPRA